jgi:hypothetical protein
MVSNKLHARAAHLRELASLNRPLDVAGVALLAVILEDLAERANAIEHLPVPPTGRVVPLRQVAA